MRPQMNTHKRTSKRRQSSVFLRVYLRPAWVVLIAAFSLRADDKKAALDQKIELMRGLEAEYATVKAPLPRSRKPLDFESTGVWNKDQWDQAGKQLGPAAKVGDLVQV